MLLLHILEVCFVLQRITFQLLLWLGNVFIKMYKFIILYSFSDYFKSRHITLSILQHSILQRLNWERYRCNTDCVKDPDNCISADLFLTMGIDYSFQIVFYFLCYFLNCFLLIDQKIYSISKCVIHS